MRRLMLVVMAMMALSLIVVDIALAQDGGEDETGAAQANEAGAGEVALLLAPLVAAATAIERLIEMFFDWYEGVVLSTGRLIGEGTGYLAFARQQVKVWKDAIADLRKSNPTKLTAEEQGFLARAEDALARAEARVGDFLKTPPYTSWKRLISLAAGIGLGIGVAFAAKLQMLAMIAGLFGGGGGTGTASVLGETATWVDMLLTGLIVGTGSAPIHSLIGLLQNTKDAVDEARALWSGSADSKAAEAYLDLQAFIERQRQDTRRLRALRGEEVEIEEVEAEEARPMSEVEMRRLIDRRLGRL